MYTSVTDRARWNERSQRELKRMRRGQVEWRATDTGGASEKGELRDWNIIVEVFLDPNMYVRRMYGRSFIRCLFVVARGCLFNFPRDFYIPKKKELFKYTYKVHTYEIHSKFFLSSV